LGVASATISVGVIWYKYRTNSMEQKTSTSQEENTQGSTTSSATVPARRNTSWLSSILAFFYSLAPGGSNGYNETDPIAASTRFRSELEIAFGNVHPTMFIGSFQQACQRAKSEYKFVVVYLHSALHRDTPTFCRETLCTELIADFFNEHFIFWTASLTMTEGYQVSNLLSASTYPFIGVICNNTVGGLAIVERIEGLIPIEDLMSKLATVLETHGPMLLTARLEHEERDKDRKLRQEQDLAFMQSLAVDQAKEQQILQQQRRIEEEKAAKEKEEQEQIEKQQQKQREREQIFRRLPYEPGLDEAGVTQLVVRLTDGSRVQRRFKNTDKLQVVFDFINSKDIEIEEYELVTNFPRKSFSDPNMTLEQAGLYPQASLFVHPLLS